MPLDYYVYYCFTTASYVWLIFPYIYLGMLQVIALILAIQTRKVRIKILNDSKEVAVIIYITSIVLVELVIVSFALFNFNNIHEVLYDAGLLIVAFAILLVTFVPKVSEGHIMHVHVVTTFIFCYHQYYTIAFHIT